MTTKEGNGLKNRDGLCLSLLVSLAFVLVAAVHCSGEEKRSKVEKKPDDKVAKLRMVSLSDLDLERSEKENKHYIKGEDVPFTGVLTAKRVEDFESNELAGKQRVHVVNGLYHGWQRFWNQKGQLYLESWSFEDKDHGFSRSWYEKSGILESETSDVDGTRTGPSRSFHANGLPSFVGHYVNNDLEGHVIWFHENGMPKETGRWKKHKRDGLHITWDDKGKAVSRKYYVEGVEATEKDWLENQEKLYKDYYKNKKPKNGK